MSSTIGTANGTLPLGVVGSRMVAWSAISGTGRWYAVWINSTGYVYSTSPDGVTWSAATALPGTTHDNGTNTGAQSLIVDAEGVLHFLAQAGPNSGDAYYWQYTASGWWSVPIDEASDFDGGQAAIYESGGNKYVWWGSNRHLYAQLNPTSASPTMPLWYGVNFPAPNTFPARSSLVIDIAGTNVIYVGLDGSGSGTQTLGGYAAAASPIPSGQNFPSASTAATGTITDDIAGCVDSAGNVHVIYHVSGTGWLEVVGSAISPGSITWSAPSAALLADTDASPALMTDSLGTVHLFYAKHNGTNDYGIGHLTRSAGTSAGGWTTQTDFIAANGVNRSAVNVTKKDNGTTVGLTWLEGSTVKFGGLAISSTTTTTDTASIQIVTKKTSTLGSPVSVTTTWPGPKAVSPITVLTKRLGVKSAPITVVTDNPGALAWPSRAAFGPNNWFDHFTGTSLDLTKWTALTTGTGSVTVTDGYAQLNTVAGNQAAAIYHNVKLDKTKSQLWTVCISSVVRPSSGARNFFRVINSAAAPTANTNANLNTNTRIIVGDANQTGGQSLLCFYEPGGTTQYWNATAATWGAYNGGRFQPIQEDDYYVLGLEVDGPGARWRLHLWGQAFTTAGTWTFDQGWRLFGLTDWVSWSTQGPSSDLWMLLGTAETDNASQQEFRVEWVRYAEGTAVDAWSAAKSSVTTGHRIKHYYSLDGITHLQETRTGLALDVGTSGSWDDYEVQRPWVVYDGVTTDYMVYVGAQSDFTFKVGIAKATHATPQNGPWTKGANNPIISPGASGALDDKRIILAVLICDQSEADPNKRWKLLYEAEHVADNKSRIFLATSPGPPDTGTWTKQGLVIDVGGAGAADEGGACSPCPVYYNNQWEVWYEAHSATQLFGLMRATGTNLATLTKDPANPYWQPTLTPDQSLTVALTTAPGRTAKVLDTTGFAADQMVSLSQSNNMDTWSQTRIRKVVDSTTLEFYHGLTGFTSSYPTKIKPDIASPNWTPRHIIRVGNEWWFYMVVWEPFSNGTDGANYNQLLEQNTLWKHSAVTPSGAVPVMQQLASPVISRGFNSDSESVENAGWRVDPFVGITTVTHSTPITVLTQRSSAKSALITVVTKKTQTAASAVTVLTNRTGSNAAPLTVTTKATRTKAAGITTKTLRTALDAAPITTFTKATRLNVSPLTVQTQRTGTAVGPISVQTRRTGSNLANISTRTSRIGVVGAGITVITSGGTQVSAPITVLTHGTVVKAAPISVLTLRVGGVMTNLTTLTSRQGKNAAALTISTTKTPTQAAPIFVATRRTHTEQAGITVRTLRLGTDTAPITVRTAKQHTETAPLTIQTKRVGVNTAALSIVTSAVGTYRNAPLTVLTRRTGMHSSPITILTEPAGANIPGLVKLTEIVTAKVALTDVATAKVVINNL